MDKKLLIKELQQMKEQVNKNKEIEMPSLIRSARLDEQSYMIKIFEKMLNEYE